MTIKEEKTMTVRELLYRYWHNNPDGHFFDPSALRFFGETIGNMRIEGVKEVETYRGEKHQCYVLSSLQKNHPMGAIRVNHYFDVNTFEFIHPSTVREENHYGHF